jgi:hypothetical protein
VSLGFFGFDLAELIVTHIKFFRTLLIHRTFFLDVNVGAALARFLRSAARF